MTGEEKIIKIIRQQGKTDIGQGLQLAEMKDSSRCQVGELILNREDYLKASHLVLQAGDMVVIYKYDMETYIILAKVV